MSRLFVVALLILLALTLGCGKADNGGDADGGDGDADSDSDSDSDVDTGFDPADLEWVEIEGGTFMMGSDDGISDNQAPAHEVDVPTFEMMRTEVTVEQYAGCVTDGACEEPDPEYDDAPCNWGVEGCEDHPVNCLDRFNALDFCEWVGGRLPTEAEWEYAGRSEGKDQMYPWGDEEPTCDLAIFAPDEVDNVDGCGEETTWPVCSKIDGNTEQGLCDMAGNVNEWVQDFYPRELIAS